MNKKSIFILSLLFFLSFSIQAQLREISGRIIDYKTKEILDHNYLTEIEVSMDTGISVFNTKTHVVENVKINDIKHHHYYLNSDGVFHKIMHILE